MMKKVCWGQSSDVSDKNVWSGGEKVAGGGERQDRSIWEGFLGFPYRKPANEKPENQGNPYVGFSRVSLVTPERASLGFFWGVLW